MSACEFISYILIIGLIFDIAVFVTAPILDWLLTPWGKKINDS